MVCYTTPMPNQEETPLPPPTFSSADIEIEKTETAPLSEPLVPEAAPVKQARKTPEKKRSPAKPLTGPTPPLSSGAEKAQKAPVVPETPKTLEARRDTTLSAYFKKVKTGTDFLQRVIDMPDHAKLCRGLNMEVAEMAQFSGKLYQQVLDFFVAFEASKETKSAGELASTGEVFISSAQIPSGCQRAIRAVVHADILKKLGLAVETPAVPPEAKTAKTKSETLPLKPAFEGGDGGRGGGEAAETSPLSRLLTPEEIVAVEQADNKRFSSLKENCDKFINPEFEKHVCDHLFHCGAGNGSFNVSYDGFFRLCSSLWHPDTIYDLKKGRLEEAWGEFIKKVRDMRSNRKEFLEKCRKCSIINLCLWCPAHAYLEVGEMDAVIEYFCKVAHARAKALV